MTPTLLPGDLFATRSPGFLGAGIRMVEWIHSRDWEATYNHAGIILDSEGTTFEALWKIRQGSLWDYCGNKVLIARYLGWTDKRGRMALAAIQAKYQNHSYPVWRILFHIIPLLGKFISSKKYGVCSEVTAEYLYYLGARHKHWPGTTPDILADEWRHWQNFEVVFEGELSNGTDTP